MSQSVASALEVVNKEGTRQTRIFISNVDCMNGRSTVMATVKRNDIVQVNIIIRVVNDRKLLAHTVNSFTELGPNC